MMLIAINFKKLKVHISNDKMYDTFNEDSTSQKSFSEKHYLRCWDWIGIWLEYLFYRVIFF